MNRQIFREKQHEKKILDMSIKNSNVNKVRA